MKHNGTTSWFDRSLRRRLMAAATLLLCAAIGQASAIRYLESGPAAEPATLRKPLDAIPEHLGLWRAVETPPIAVPKNAATKAGSPRRRRAQPHADHPRTNDPFGGETLLRFATERLRRDYRHQRSGQRVAVWIAYSPDGADRQHHPEVCLSVAGQQEDPKGRARLAVGHRAQPIRRYRFIDGQRGQWLFYWYYTLRPQTAAQPGTLRTLYHRLRHRPASVTIEVFAPDTGPAGLTAAEEFVALLDAALQDHLPSRAVRGSQPLSVTVVRPNGP